jgi:hypothetical protein
LGWILAGRDLFRLLHYVPVSRKTWVAGMTIPNPRRTVPQNNKKTRKGKAQPPQKAARRAPRRVTAARAQTRTTTAPVAMNTSMLPSQPRISRTSLGTCRIQHRELVQTLQASDTNDTLFRIPINPGLLGTFPWLSHEAAGWERYRFSRLAFRYLARTGTINNGSLTMAPDYDPTDTSPLSADVLAAYSDAVEASVWKDQVCVLKPSSMHAADGEKFVRRGATADVRLTDVGNFLFIISPVSVPGLIGRLWVEYDVTFHTPQIPDGGNESSGYLVTDAKTAVDGDIFGTNPLSYGSLHMSDLGSNQMRIENMTVGQQYLLTLSLRGSGIDAHWQVASIITGIDFIADVGYGIGGGGSSTSFAWLFRATNRVGAVQTSAAIGLVGSYAQGVATVHSLVPHVTGLL